MCIQKVGSISSIFPADPAYTLNSPGEMNWIQPNSWVESIKLIYSNQELLDTVAENGIKLIRDKYNLKFFNDNLERILF